MHAQALYNFLELCPQPPVGGVYVVGWSADRSGLLALDNQHPPVVGIGGISE